MTRVSRDHSSPNFGSDPITPDFAVLHYTATDLTRTLAIFADPARGVAAHFVIDVDGTTYDLGGFWDGPIRRGAHAGESRADLDGREVTTLNDRSIGVEIVNFNGNVFDYTGAQYAALAELLGHLTARFPALHRPGRVLGHEHVAGFRGKCDPGLRFDWARVLGAIGAPLTDVHHRHACTPADVASLTADPARAPEEWENLSSQLEARVRARVGGDR